jgi:iron complex transport system permease protein
MAFRLAGLLLVALGAMLAGLLVGGTFIPPAHVFAALLHPRGTNEIATIVWQLRLPRVALGAVVGAALAISGALLQGMLRNPLVDPFLTGVSSGAAVAIVLGIVTGVAALALPALGFAAGMGTALVVAALARRGSGIEATRLILAGVSLSSLFSATIALVLTRLQTVDAAPAIIGWLAGSLAGRGWSDLFFCAPYVLCGLLLAFLSAPALNVLRLGEIRAASVGVDVPRAQWIILAASSLLTASAVTLSGTVGFAGLIVPHIARRVTGSDARASIAASAFIGAALVVLADALCRSIAPPTEIPIGVLLAFIGVPAFLYLYLHRERAAVA